MKTPIKTYLFENDGLVTRNLQEWILSLDKDYKEINTSQRNYSRSHDLYFFALLINPDLERIVTSSAFPSKMDYSAIISFGKDRDDVEGFSQLEYFSWLFFEAVRFRMKNELQPLIIDINYLGEDFLEDLKNGQWDRETKINISLMLRQSEGFVIINLYKDFKLYKTLKTEEDLGYKLNE